MTTYYTKEDYAKAYTEVLEILKQFSKDALEKIPKEKLQMYKSLKDNSYTFAYDENKEFEEQNISKLAIIIIANIYIEYLANEEEKCNIKENDKKELQILENQKRELYNPDNIFDNREKAELKQQNKNVENESLIITKKENILTKIINKIKLILYTKKSH